MNWKELLSTQKLGDEDKEPRDWAQYPINDFEKDYNKIVSSAAFRRLQDKTQVFPLDKSDFVRTRLTHSIEVSTIARQLGIMISKNTTQYRRDEVADNAEGISSVLLCAGLLHDIGNPPFGHYGETVIGEWFQDNLDRIYFRSRPLRTVLLTLGDQAIYDLEHFEGNAQTFRILAKARHGSEINLSTAVISTLIKYPTASSSADREDPNVARHKFGYYYADQETFLHIAKTAGTLQADGTICRHPLTFLLEAADDIAYATADLEDAFKKRLFSLNDFIQFFNDGYDHSKVNVLTPQKHGYTQEHYAHELIQALENSEAASEHERFRQWVQYTRRWLMHNVIFRFSRNYDEIMAGTFEQDLFQNINHTITMQILKNAMKKFVYRTPGIVKLELSAQTILSFLLDRFVHAALYYDCTDETYRPSKADEKRLTIFSENYKIDYEKEKTGNEAHDLYLRLLMVTDYISGMTDTYARTLYRELSGIE